jgi:hypothetical protein
VNKIEFVKIRGWQGRRNASRTDKARQDEVRQARLTLRQHCSRLSCTVRRAAPHLHRGPLPSAAWNWHASSLKPPTETSACGPQDPSCMWQAQGARCKVQGARDEPSCSTWDAYDRAVQRQKSQDEGGHLGHLGHLCFIGAKS